MTALIDHALAPVAQDKGPFFYLGPKFLCNEHCWIGRAVISPQAIYLLKKRQIINGGGAHFGLIGVLANKFLTIPDTMSTCSLDDIPADIRARLDPKGKVEGVEVIIIPRSTVSMVKTARLSATLRVAAGTDSFVIDGDYFFGVSKIHNQLRRMGWKLNTRLQPTSAAVHDSTPEEMKDPVASSRARFKLKCMAIAWMVVGLIIVGIAQAHLRVHK